MNISKGNQATSGSDAVVIGNMANSLSCDPAPGGGILFQWELKHLASAPDAVRVQPASDGSVWLLIGVDLAPIGRYELYVTNFSATLQRVT